MLTPSQLVTLKTGIQSNPDFWLNGTQMLGNEEMASAYNQPSSPAHTVWKTDVLVDDIMRNGMDWSRVDNLSVGKARIWDWMTRLGTLNASKANIRAGIDASWVGTTADLAVRAVVYTHCKRNATIAEKIFATGAGTTDNPSTMGFEGLIAPEDITNAIYS